MSTIIRRYDLRVFAEAVVPPFMIPRFGAPIPFALIEAEMLPAPAPRGAPTEDAPSE